MPTIHPNECQIRDDPARLFPVPSIQLVLQRRLQLHDGDTTFGKPKVERCVATMDHCTLWVVTSALTMTTIVQTSYGTMNPRQKFEPFAQVCIDDMVERWRVTADMLELNLKTSIPAEETVKDSHLSNWSG